MIHVVIQSMQPSFASHINIKLFQFVDMRYRGSTTLWSQIQHCASRGSKRLHEGDGMQLKYFLIHT
jgi:hypothetical protein